jgi:hypothetical protein
MTDKPRRYVNALEFIDRISNIEIEFRAHGHLMAQAVNMLATVRIGEEWKTFMVLEMFHDVALRESVLGSRGVKRELVARFAKLLDEIESAMQEEAAP